MIISFVAKDKQLALIEYYIPNFCLSPYEKGNIVFHIIVNVHFLDAVKTAMKTLLCILAEFPLVFCRQYKTMSLMSIDERKIFCIIFGFARSGTQG